MKTRLLKRCCSLGALAVSTALVTTALGSYHLPALRAQSVSGGWLQVQRIVGTVRTEISERREARVGDRLSAPGHSAVTGRRSSASLLLDNGIGSLSVAQSTHMTIQEMMTLPDGARVTVLDVPRGQVRVQVRSFTNPNSRLELHTPSGVAAVRGTEFGVAVAEDGKTSISTLEGQVEASAQNVVVPVDPGLASVIRPGEPPTPAQPLDRELDIQWRSQERRGNQLYLAGQIDRANILLLNGEEIPLSRTGAFEATVSSGNRHRAVVFTVQNPVGESRMHRLRAWQVRDVDGSGSD